VTFVMRAWGVSYKTAARWLRERFGPPTEASGPIGGKRWK
jgi:hypothetical protein